MIEALSQFARFPWPAIAGPVLFIFAVKLILREFARARVGVPYEEFRREVDQLKKEVRDARVARRELALELKHTRMEQARQRGRLLELERSTTP